MAGHRNFQERKESVGKRSTVQFDGGLSTGTRSTLVCELLKHLILQRNQIPLSVEQIRRDLKRHNPAENESKKHAVMKRVGLNKIEHRKAKEAVCVIDQLVDEVKYAFENCPDIRQVLIVFGGTVISPKEMYLVDLPEVYQYHSTLSAKQSIKTLFRQLISENFLCSSKPLPITNTTILLSAPRHSPLKSFHAKPRYRPPQRGLLYRLEWASPPTEDCDSDLSIADEAVDISGIQPLDISEIQPLDTSYNDTSLSHMEVLNPNLCNNKEETTHHGNSHTIGELPPLQDEGIHSLSEEEFIWFQAPFVIKGYKDRTSKIMD